MSGPSTDKVTSPIRMFSPFSFLWADTYPQWIKHENYQSNEEREKAFEVAREYFISVDEEKNEVSEYSYYVYEIDSVFVVSITAIYKCKNEKCAVVDGDKCVYVNKLLKIKGMRQCLSPALDLLEG